MNIKHLAIILFPFTTAVLSGAAAAQAVEAENGEINLSEIVIEERMRVLATRDEDAAPLFALFDSQLGAQKLELEALKQRIDVLDAAIDWKQGIGVVNRGRGRGQADNSLRTLGLLKRLEELERVVKALCDDAGSQQSKTVCQSLEGE